MNHPELDMQTIRQRLFTLRAELLEESESSRESRDTVMLDQTSVGRLSRMDALQGQAMAKAEEERRQLALKRITAALTRIAWDPLVLKCIDCAS